MNDDPRANASWPQCPEPDRAAIDGWLATARERLGAAAAAGGPASPLSDLNDWMRFEDLDDDDAGERAAKLAAAHVDAFHTVMNLRARELLAQNTLATWQTLETGRPVLKIASGERLERLPAPPTDIPSATVFLANFTAESVAALALAVRTVASEEVVPLLDASLRELEEKHGEGLAGRLDAYNLTDRGGTTPRSLAACLAEVFHPPDVVVAWGHLAGDSWTRVFRQFPLLFADDLPVTLFEEARESADWLRRTFKPPTQNLPAIGYVCPRLVILGSLARQILECLSLEPDDDRLRPWARFTLNNLCVLGSLAVRLSPQPFSSIPPSSAVRGPVPPVEAEATEVDPCPTAAGLAELQELAERSAAIAGRLEAVGRPDASEAVARLREAGLSLRARLRAAEARAAGADLSDDEVAVVGRAQADEMLDTLLSLDALLPGIGEDGPVPPARPLPDDLVQTVGELRDAVYAYLEQFGGYHTVPAKPGLGPAFVEEWQRQLEITGPALRSRYPRNVIACVVRPGYYWERDGKRQTVHRAAVRLA